LAAVKQIDILSASFTQNIVEELFRLRWKDMQ